MNRFQKFALLPTQVVQKALDFLVGLVVHWYSQTSIRRRAL
jgi:hypothetical protein